MSETFSLLVSSTESGEIHSFSMDSISGELNLLEIIKLHGSGNPTRGNIPLVLDHTNNFLYAHTRAEPFHITTFIRDLKSKKFIYQNQVQLIAPMAYLSLSLNGKFLLGASYDHAIFSVNNIFPDGKIETKNQKSISSPPKAHCIIVAPFGGFAYGTSVDADAILVFRFDEINGNLEELSSFRVQSRKNSGPRHLVFHPNLDCLYCINEHDGTLDVFGVERITGQLKLIQSLSLMPSDFVGNAMAADIHMTPDGNLIYASVRTTNTITGFQINQFTGLLVEINKFDVEKNPRGFAIDPLGNYLVCAGQESNSISVFKIELSTGNLLFQNCYSVGKRPSWIEISY
jgi:6-phosphogluconolactonase